jgi:hypothetical protein
MEGDALQNMELLVEAADRYELARRTVITDESPEQFVEAVSDAEARLVEVTKRMPQLRLDVAGQPGAARPFEVRMNGRRVPEALIGVRHPVNPGRTALALLRGGRTVGSWQVVLREGRVHHYVLRDEPASNRAPETSRNTAGWVALAVGGAGIATGAVSGLFMLGAQSKLDDACERRGDEYVCSPAVEDDLQRFRTARTVSYVAYGVGILGTATGGALLLFGAGQDKKRAHVVPWVTPHHAGVTGALRW